MIELRIGLIELRIGLIELGIVLIDLVIGLIELGIGLMELWIGLRINNAWRTVLARVSGLVFFFSRWGCRGCGWGLDAPAHPSATIL